MVDKINTQYQRGLITDDERYQKVIKLWQAANKEIQAELLKISKKDFPCLANPII